MVLTVTPNTAMDITYTVEGFTLDRVHRPSAVRTVAGGKGINVARVLTTLGRNAIATGFVGGCNGATILEKIAIEGLAHDFVKIRSESRLCIAIVDPNTGIQTEVNENGPAISPNEIADMMDKVIELLPGRQYITLCGSCPPGVPTSFYGDIIKAARSRGVKAVLDTSGEHLQEALKAKPYMVKPNVAELSQIAGREILTVEEIVRSAKSLKQFGVRITAVTMGRAGAIVTDGVQTWHATPPEIRFASAVGSGDAFLAAFLDDLISGSALPDALVSGTAAGAANATTYGAGFCSKESIMEMRQGVSLSKID